MGFWNFTIRNSLRAHTVLFEDRDEVYSRIEHGELRFPRHLSPEVVSLIKGLLDRNPATRLGQGPTGISEIKDEEFFAGMDWDALLAREDHPDNIGATRNPVAGLDKKPSGQGSRDETSAGDLIGQDADMLLDDDEDTNGNGRNGRNRPDVLAMFIATKKKQSNIAGYSYMARPAPPSGVQQR